MTHMKAVQILQNVSFALATASLGLVIWSQVVWDGWGYDYPLWKGVVNVAAIGGWYLGWILLISSAGASLAAMLLRRRRGDM
ncbi:MAG: hypothetical protein C0483_21415 [Pirellula sp.]|nr:hypothetical protein [Pirellula sp.]